MEKVEIRFYATALNNKSDHALHGVTLHVVKSGNNRFIGTFDSIDKAVLYALNNNFEIVGLSKEQEDPLMIRWLYTKYGTVLIDQIDNNEAYTGKSVYLQTEEDVNSFLEYIGITADQLDIGDGDTCKDVGYFED